MAGARGSARRKLVARLLGSRNRRRGQRSRAAVLRAGAAVALPVAVVATLVTFAWPPVRAAIRRHPYFAVREVVVRDTHRVSADAIRHAAAIEPGMSVWDVDAAAAEARLRAEPWVRAAHVRRELPHRVVIAVREERPAAIVVVGDGKAGAAGEYYVSARGHVFARVAPGDAKDLPYVTGLAAADIGPG
jgi:cell division protein FtsQ